MKTLLLTLALATGFTPQETPTETAPKETAPEVHAFLDECAESVLDVRSLRIGFKQTKTLRILRRPRESQGTLLLADGKLLMTIKDATGARETQLYVADGKAQMYYPRDARVEIYDLEGGAAAPTPFPMFGADMRELPKTYAIELERLPSGEVELAMTPRAEGSSIDRVRLRFRDHHVVEMEQLNGNGNSVLMRVEVYEKNPELPANALNFELPEGTEVVQALGSSGRSDG